MRKLFLILVVLMPGLILGAQDLESAADILSRPAQVDSQLASKGLYASLPLNVTLNQSASVADGFRALVEKNSRSELFTGFRIKLFQSSAQTAREESERLVESFSVWYPGIPVYRTFTSPYFKVSVGDFRTRVDAERTLRLLQESFPTATIVKEKMKYPYID